MDESISQTKQLELKTRKVLLAEFGSHQLINIKNLIKLTPCLLLSAVSIIFYVICNLSEILIMLF
ncbi:hypothetical protein A6301_07205 [Pectobacterium sp. IFB5596]|nr:hypothetical protein [Pectobacterium sp. IFB5596]